MLLAATGGIAGAAIAFPVLLTLASLAAPFSGTVAEAVPPGDIVAALPASLWLTLPGLPAAAAAIGFLTAQATVRRWLRRLP
jgi:cell division transport system permease protein